MSNKEEKTFSIFYLLCLLFSAQVILPSQLCIDRYVCIFTGIFILLCPRLIRWLFLLHLRNSGDQTVLKIFDQNLPSLLLYQLSLSSFQPRSCSSRLTASTAWKNTSCYRQTLTSVSVSPSCSFFSQAWKPCNIPD